jgi:polar amino acid transport system substrate-binding protein
MLRARRGDNISITMKLKDGSLASILYVAGGDKRFPRERIEVFGGGCVGIIDNFRAASFFQNGRSSRIRNWFGVDRTP